MLHLATRSLPSQNLTTDDHSQMSKALTLPVVIEVGLLTGGGDRHYAFGLAMALITKGVRLDFIGGDEVDSPEMHGTPGLSFFNLRRNGRRNARFVDKIARLLMYYVRLVSYAATAKPKVFHILWNNKFEFFDRTLLMLYYKVLGKKITLTAHNINAGTRDSLDTPLNRFTLRMQYRLTDHIFVHTEKMKSDLLEQFGVRQSAVTIIPYGINNAVPSTGLDPEEAKRRLGIRNDEKTILFFGNIAPYKGLEYLLAAFEQIVTTGENYRLIVAGRSKHGCDKYVDEIQQTLNRTAIRERTILRIEFIPDEDMELYFMAADVSVLPYTHIFQSGVLFLAYAFGLPVIAADVGSLREDIVEGRTGFLFRPQDSADLAKTIKLYFASVLYKSLSSCRQDIRNYATDRHSWDSVSTITRNVYAQLLEE